MKNKLNLSNSLWVVGILVAIFFSYLDFDPTKFLQIIIPIMLASSFGLLGVFAITEVRKTIKEHYGRNTKNTLREIESIRLRQEHQNLRDQIKGDEQILNLRQSLRGYKRDYFELCVKYSAILFAIALLSTFIDFGSYISIPNFVIMLFFSFWGLFYFSRMIQAIFIALNIVRLD